MHTPFCCTVCFALLQLLWPYLYMDQITPDLLEAYPWLRDWVPVYLCLCSIIVCCFIASSDIDLLFYFCWKYCVTVADWQCFVVVFVFTFIKCFHLSFLVDFAPFVNFTKYIYLDKFCTKLCMFVWIKFPTIPTALYWDGHPSKN